VVVESKELDSTSILLLFFSSTMRCCLYSRESHMYIESHMYSHAQAITIRPHSVSSEETPQASPMAQGRMG
jgi:hypothetical protein